MAGEDIFAALHGFIANGQKDPKAAIINNSNFVTPDLKIYMVFFFYDGAVPPPGTFGKFEDIIPVLDTTSTRNYTDLVSAPNFSCVGMIC